MMRNYIKAELYRNFNRAYFWNLTGIVSILAVLVNITLKVTSVTSSTNMSEVFQIGTVLIINISIYFVLMTVDMITGEEQKNLTLKNSISSGLSRNKIVLSKNIATIILSLAPVIIILTTFFGSGMILFGLKGATLDMLRVFLLKLLATMFLSIGAMSVGTFLAFVIKNNTVYAFAYFGFISITPIAIQILSALVSNKFMYVHNILITTHLKKLSMGSEGTINMNDFTSAIILGIAYFIIFTFLSIVVFRKKEVK